MSTHNIFIATYTRPQLAETSLAKMHEAGLDLHKLRIISQDDFDVPKQHEGAAVLHSFDELEPDFSPAYLRMIAKPMQQNWMRAAY